MLPNNILLKKKNERGFTLIEIVIVILIVGIISSIGVALLSEATEAISFLTIRSDLAQSADVALARMSREIRRLKNDTSILNATVNRFAFCDNSVNSVLIDYYLNGINLIRYSNDTDSADILASNINSLVFIYYDNSGNPISPPTFGIGTLTNIRRVEITLTFQSGLTHTINFRTLIRPRNLRHFAYKFS